MTSRLIPQLGFPGALLITVLFTSHCAKLNRPFAAVPPQPRPSQQQRPPEPVPRLEGSGADARRAVVEFLRWAGAARQSQREAGRAQMAAAGANPEIVAALVEETKAAVNRDHSRALLALSVLGEMRSVHAVSFLKEFIHQPLPRPGRLIEGEDPAQTGLATLQAKAVSGLAYLRQAAADEEVFWAVGQHESRIVRAEAIRSYLLNHNQSQEARTILLRHVRKGEEAFVDRPNRNPGEAAASFNQKLARYVESHPERQAPAPERGKYDGKPGRRSGFKQPPPAF